MNPRLALLLAWILVGAAVVTVHLHLLWQLIRARRLPFAYRLLAFVPVLPPILAWLDGRRITPILWFLLVGAYAVLRTLG
jgi:hypothetical protein